MTIMSRPYNDESRNEYDRIFGHGEPKAIKLRLLNGPTVKIYVDEITEEPKDISTFDDKNRVLIVCGDDSLIVSGSYSEIYNAWRENNEKQKNI